MSYGLYTDQGDGELERVECCDCLYETWEWEKNYYNKDYDTPYLRVPWSSDIERLWDVLVADRAAIDHKYNTEPGEDTRYLKIPVLPNVGIDYDTLHFLLNPIRLGMETNNVPRSFWVDVGSGTMPLADALDKKIRQDWFAYHFILKVIKGQRVVDSGWHQSCYSRFKVFYHLTRPLSVYIDVSSLSAFINADKHYRQSTPIIGDRCEFCVSDRSMGRLFKPFDLEYNNKGSGLGKLDPAYTDPGEMLAAFKDLYDVVVQIVEGKPIVSEYWSKKE